MKVTAEQLHGLIIRLQVVFSEIDYAQKACLQAGKMECQLLNYLYKIKEPVNMNELAKVLSVSHSRVTRIMDNLVSKKLVLRKPSDKDRRCWFAQITDKGRKLAENSQQTVVDQQKKILAQINEKQSEEILSALKIYVEKYENVLKATLADI
ncbi:MAG TPA: MarR family transcriptional regulator [Candidatus Syntrophosphaera sp.]|nr:MarR family transcriptional regulator [Candidatus Syntrophosphaera sp.]